MNQTFKWNFVDSIWTPTEYPTVVFVPTGGALNMDERKLEVGNGLDKEAEDKFPSMSSVAFGTIQSRGSSVALFVPKQGPKRATVSYYAYPPILLYRPVMNFGLGIYRARQAPWERPDLSVIKGSFTLFMKLINYLVQDPSMKLMGENNLPENTEFRLGLPKLGAGALDVGETMDALDGIAQSCYINQGMQVYPTIYTKGKDA